MDKKKRYMFITRTIDNGGAERVISVIANHLADNGYDVSILAYKRMENEYRLHENVKVLTMPARKDSLLTKALRISDMRRILEETRPDVVIPFIETVLIVAWAASGMGKTPYILTIRNSPWHEPSTKWRRRQVDRIAKKAAAIMIQNEEQAEYFPEKLRDKMFVVNNPLSDEFFLRPKETYAGEIRRIVTAGRLSPQKNQKLLLQAAERLIQENPGLRFEIYGNGGLRSELEAFIQSRGLREHVFLMGRSSDMPEVLRGADLFVMTSDFEGMPNALMEAMAVGVPVLSSDCPTGPKSLIAQGVDGMLFETGNQRDLEEKLRWLLRRPDEAAQMGRRAAVKMRENYTYEQIFTQMDRLLSFVCGD